MTKKTVTAFTLIELLVVIAIIAILASIALPVFTSVQVKGSQTKALSNAKQIGLALRLFAGDNSGVYPSYTLNADGSTSTTQVSTSNQAFAELFPTYVKSENIFWLGKSKWCNAGPPDEVSDPNPANTGGKTLDAGENEWAYVINLNDTSNPSVPLIADGFVSGGAVSHAYTNDQTLPGGVWKGVNAIVVRADSSAALEKVNQTNMQVYGPNGTTGGAQGDIFTTGNGSNGWLGTTNTVVNPIAPP